MSDRRTALLGASFDGTCAVAETALQGMITLRGTLDDPVLQAAVAEATGAEMPGLRQIMEGSSGAVAWMSPDELLLLVPHGQAPAIAARLTEALADQHAMVAEVSDARAVFTVTGPTAREVIARLCPVDMAPGRFEAGEMRRTRMAQVPAAFWLSGSDQITVICFRSVAQYVFDLLRQAAQPGGEVGVFA